MSSFFACVFFGAADKICVSPERKAILFCLLHLVTIAAKVSGEEMRGNPNSTKINI